MVNEIQNKGGILLAPPTQQNRLFSSVVVLFYQALFSSLYNKQNNLRRSGADDPEALQARFRNRWAGCSSRLAEVDLRGFLFHLLTGKSSFQQTGPGVLRPPAGSRYLRSSNRSLPKIPRETGEHRLELSPALEESDPANLNRTWFPASHLNHSSKQNGKQYKSVRNPKSEPISQSESESKSQWERRSKSQKQQFEPQPR